MCCVTFNDLSSFFWILLVFLQGFLEALEKNRGPMFISEPPPQVEFLNTSGATVDCLAYGSPAPRVFWRVEDGSPAHDIPGLRSTLPNGTLVLWSFRPEQYSQEVHSKTYVCVASNSVGTIRSRNVRVRGEVSQEYAAQVYDIFVVRGNTAVITCHIPMFVKDYITVTSWIRGDSDTITSTSQEGGRYSVFFFGELHIRNATTLDENTYRCQTTHRITQEHRLSATKSTLFIRDSSGTMSPRIKDSRQLSISAMVGEFVELPCAAQGFPLPRYSWYKYTGTNQSHLTPVYLDPRTMQLSGSLIFHSVTLEDAGKYVCVISNSAGEERYDITLIIRAHLSAQVQPQEQIVDVGKVATFNCSFSGYPVDIVKWYKNGEPLYLEDIRIQMLSKFSVSFNPVQREDKGIYQCVVSNDHDSAQGTAQLVLGDAEPVFHFVFSKKTLQPKTFHSLKCAAFGNPLPQITWTLDGEPLRESQSLRVGDYITRQGLVVSYVNITSVAVQDGGEYRCRATNSVGRVAHSARVNVYGLPFVRPMSDVSAVAGENLHLRCQAAGYPINSITWYKGRMKLPINLRQEVFTNGTILIRDVSRELDDGLYTCRATNDQGQSDSGTVRVTVMVRPVIDPFSFPRNIQEGMRARLVCTVIKGDPPLSIQWYKDGQPLHQGLNGKRTKDEFSSDLFFSNVQTHHNGNYTCKVSNAAASVSHSAVLVVDVPPKWDVEPRDTAVVAGQNVRIDCLASGFPSPVVTWERKSGNIPGHYSAIASGPHYEVYPNGSLLIKDTQPEDGGFYSCQANNGIESGLSKVVFLTVHVPPRFETKFRSKMATKGKEVRMKCRATGDHPMTIVWSVNGQHLNPSDNSRYKLREQVGNKEISSEITILAADRQDSANFTCLVKNSFGQHDTRIMLVVQEPPDMPREVKVLEKKSRSVVIGWSVPFNGNSNITRYLLHCSPSQESWQNHIINLTVDRTESTAKLKGLRPAQSYKCRVSAENGVGIGPLSEEVSVITTDEVPGGPPQGVKAEAVDSQTVHVTWQPPERELWNGPLKGYYVGYKVHNSDAPYLYKNLEVGKHTREEVVLSQLQKFTSYTILVQAYNSMGAGPRSDEVVVQTLEDIPSEPPQNLQCSPMTSETLLVKWEAPPLDSIHGKLQGYTILYRPVEEKPATGYEERTVTREEAKLTHLQKFTNYSIAVMAYTQKGSGVKSNPIFCRTQEDAPSAPADIKAVVVSKDTIWVVWKPPSRPNGIITNYSLFWRSAANGHKNATVIPVQAGQLDYKVSGFQEGSRNEFWVTASTSRGEGDPTRVVSQTTTRRVPARIINFGQALTAPFGGKISLPCHAVGHPEPGRKWTIGSKPFVKSEQMEVQKDGSLYIRKLQYLNTDNYTCHVHNKHGADEITYSLNMQAPFQGVEVKLLSSSLTSANFSISDTFMEGNVQDFSVHYKPEGGQWKQQHLDGRERQFTLQGLRCGTSYRLYLVAFTRETQKRSEQVLFRTEGSAPPTPIKEELLSANATHILIHLSAWEKRQSCPVTRMVIEYRLQSQDQWITFMDKMTPFHQNHVVIPDLNSETWYVVRISADSDMGSVRAKYDIKTRRQFVAFPPDSSNPGHVSSSTSFFEDTTTLVSMVSSVVVLIAGVIAVVCLVMYKRRRNNNNRHHYRPTRTQATVSSSRSDVATTTALMSHTEKKSQRSEASRQSHSRELPSYFSSPVRKVTPSNNVAQAKQLNNSPSTSHYFEDEIAPYATFRLPEEGVHNEETEEFKTFSVKHGEPPYLTKASLDPPSKTGKGGDEFYSHSQCTAPNSHSLTSGSSNQEELMRAYEYARRHPPPSSNYEQTRGLSHTSGTTESEATDPGIRQFTGSPPKPNERRQGACFTPGLPSSTPVTKRNSSSSDEVTPVNSPPQTRELVANFGALPRDKSRQSWGGAKSRAQPACRRSSKGIKKGLSSDESDSEGTIYTFSQADTVVLRGSSGNELSETECDWDRLTRFSRGRRKKESDS
ncbi:cell adhesion molecule Dscam1-like isoform X2 [Tachypleus tridentatus]|uniref:cell adhesion molecule Dscam1-like isoform X2 n=1 Tax=Tachypleus tridentatus TaxID=6853 RepID=UPI003FCF0E74